MDLLDSERVRLDRERELEDVLDRVLGHPLETRVVRRVDRLEVLQTHVPRAEKLSVDRSDEVGIEQSTVLDGLGCEEYVKARGGVSPNAARAKQKESDVPITTPTNLKKARWSGLTALRRLNWYVTAPPDAGSNTETERQRSISHKVAGVVLRMADAQAKSGLKIDLARTL